MTCPPRSSFVESYGIQQSHIILNTIDDPAVQMAPILHNRLSRPASRQAGDGTSVNETETPTDLEELAKSSAVDIERNLGAEMLQSLQSIATSVFHLCDPNRGGMAFEVGLDQALIMAFEPDRSVMLGTGIQIQQSAQIPRREWPSQFGFEARWQLAAHRVR